MDDLKHLFVIDDTYNVYEVAKLIKGRLKDEIDYIFKLYNHKYSIAGAIDCKNSINLYVNNKETISSSYYYVKIEFNCISNSEFYKNMNTYNKEYNSLLTAAYTSFIHTLEYLSSPEFADIISNYVKTVYERIKNLETGTARSISTKETAKFIKDYVDDTNIRIGEKQNMFNTIKSITVNKEKRIVTCVFMDNDVRMSKCSSEDEFDVYVGVALCIAQHTYRSKTKFKKAVDRLTEKKKKG